MLGPFAPEVWLGVPSCAIARDVPATSASAATPPRNLFCLCLIRFLLSGSSGLLGFLLLRYVQGERGLAAKVSVPCVMFSFVKVPNNSDALAVVHDFFVFTQYTIKIW
jgi:hypothetical protein